MILLTVKFALKMRLQWSNLWHSSRVNIYPVPSTWHQATLPRGQGPLPNCGLNLWGTEFLSGFFSLSSLPNAENFTLKRVLYIIITKVFSGTVLNAAGTLVHLVLTAVLWGEYSNYLYFMWRKLRRKKNKCFAQGHPGVCVVERSCKAGRSAPRFIVRILNSEYLSSAHQYLYNLGKVVYLLWALVSLFVR